MGRITCIKFSPATKVCLIYLFFLENSFHFQPCHSCREDFQGRRLGGTNPFILSGVEDVYLRKLLVFLNPQCIIPEQETTTLVLMNSHLPLLAFSGKTWCLDLSKRIALLHRSRRVLPKICSLKGLFSALCSALALQQQEQAAPFVTVAHVPLPASIFPPLNENFF